VIGQALRRARSGEELTGHLSLAGRLEIFIRVCDAVAYAHSKHILHRDLKPENVMVGPYQEVYVLDWGLARPARSATVDGAAVPSFTESEIDAMDITMAGELLAPGVHGAGAPEQSDRGQRWKLRSVFARGGPVRADLFEIRLRGRGPHRPGRRHRTRANRAGDLGRARAAHLPRPTGHHQKSNGVDPAQRYPSAQALAEDLRHLIHDEPLGHVREPLFRRAARLISHYRETVLIALLLAVLSGAGFGAWWAVERRHTEMLRHELTLRTNARMTEVANQRRQLERLTNRFERLLARLAAAAQMALTRPAAAGEVYYLNDAFVPRTSPGRRPIATRSAPVAGDQIGPELDAERTAAC